MSSAGTICIASLISIVLVFCSASTAYAQLNWLFGPKDYEDCVANEVRGANTREAIAAAFISCSHRFVGRRAPDGDGYVLQDPTFGNFRIRGPNPTREEAAAFEAWKLSERSARLQEEERQRNARLVEEAHKREESRRISEECDRRKASGIQENWFQCFEQRLR